MFPIIICRHYDVVWLDSHTCDCQDCGKQGHWMDDGFVIWMKAVSTTSGGLGGYPPKICEL